MYYKKQVKRNEILMVFLTGLGILFLFRAEFSLGSIAIFGIYVFLIFNITRVNKKFKIMAENVTSSWELSVEECCFDLENLKVNDIEIGADFHELKVFGPAEGKEGHYRFDNFDLVVSLDSDEKIAQFTAEIYEQVKTPLQFTYKGEELKLNARTTTEEVISKWGQADDSAFWQDERICRLTYNQEKATLHFYWREDHEHSFSSLSLVVPDFAW
jgi:hypothetical protein